MPSDNEEQAVDAKTIAELTEQVRRKREDGDREEVFHFFFNARNQSSLSFLLLLSRSHTFLPSPPRALFDGGSLTISYFRHWRAVGIGTRARSEVKSSRMNADALSISLGPRRKKKKKDDTRARAAVPPVVGRARPAGGLDGAGLGAAPGPRGVAGAVSDRQQPEE